MKTAFQKVLNKVNSAQIENIASICKITLPMLLEIFDQKKGLKVSEMLKALPKTDLYVLDALCNLYDRFGEEKSIKFDQIYSETL